MTVYDFRPRRDNLFSESGVGESAMAMVDTAVRLAHEEPFLIGGLSVRPETRELVGAQGRRELLEPRVMQVLVRLWRADGAVLTRDDLLRTCWDGRVVGEDAINRVMSRLRRVALDHPEAGFRVETITKVGYRLVQDEAPAASVAEPRPLAGPAPEHVAANDPTADKAPPNRRLLLAAAAVAGLGGIAGAGAWLRARRPALDVHTRALYDHGWTALNEISPAQSEQAIALFRAVVAAAPDYADGWGSLAQAYACGCGAAEDPANSARRQRAQAAAARAVQLDPGNALATAALVEIEGVYQHWSAAERALRQGLARHPRAMPLMLSLRSLLSSVGRNREAAGLGDRVVAASPPTPLLYARVQELEAAGRLEEADRASAQMIALFPGNIPVWFTHFYHLARNGRPADALAFGMNLATRPPGVPDDNFEITMAGAQALLTRAPADINRAMGLALASARQASGYAENALLLAAQLGRLDDAFALAQAYYFGRGFSPPMLSFSTTQKQYYRERRTHLLFWPCAAQLRADPRFAALTREIGLADYWKRAGSGPD